MKGLGVLSLEGKRALITGGGTGLGRSLARGFAEAGAEVVICGRRREPLEETRAAVVASGGTCELVVCDITVEADVARLRDAAGTIDILVNNAGISPDESWETVSLESWRAVFDVNLLAPFRLCQVFAPAMRDRGLGPDHQHRIRLRQHRGQALPLPAELGSVLVLRLEACRPRADPEPRRPPCPAWRLRELTQSGWDRRRDQSRSHGR